GAPGSSPPCGSCGPVRTSLASTAWPVAEPATLATLTTDPPPTPSPPHQTISKPAGNRSSTNLSGGCPTRFFQRSTSAGPPPETAAISSRRYPAPTPAADP